MSQKSSKFVNSVTYNPALPSYKEHVGGKSMTVAGESYTVRELFERHLKGQLPDVSRESYYEDTQDFDAIDFQQLKNADPFEKELLLQQVMDKAEKAQLALQKWREQQEHEEEEETEKPSSPPKKPKAKKEPAGEPESKRSDANDASSAGDPK